MIILKPGLVTNSILFCWLFEIKDRCKKVRFQQTHNQGLRQLLLTVSWDLRAKCGTPDGVLVSLYFRAQRTRQVKGPWRVLCQLKNPFKGPRPRRWSFWEKLKWKDFNDKGSQKGFTKRKHRKLNKWPHLGLVWQTKCFGVLQSPTLAYPRPKNGALPLRKINCLEEMLLILPLVEINPQKPLGFGDLKIFWVLSSWEVPKLEKGV